MTPPGYFLRWIILEYARKSSGSCVVSNQIRGRTKRAPRYPPLSVSSSAASPSAAAASVAASGRGSRWRSRYSPRRIFRQSSFGIEGQRLLSAKVQLLSASGIGAETPVEPAGSDECKLVSCQQGRLRQATCRMLWLGVSIRWRLAIDYWRHLRSSRVACARHPVAMWRSWI